MRGMVVGEGGRSSGVLLYNDLRALSGKICFTLLMAKMHLDKDEQRKGICCLNVRCLSKYIPRNLMDSCSFVSPTICMGYY